MKIRVKLFASMRINNQKELFLDMPDKATPRNIIEELNIPERSARLILINGEKGKLDTILYEGDTVSIFPTVGGG